MKNEPTIPGEPQAGIAAGVMLGTTVFSGLSFLLFKIPYPAKMGHYLEHLKSWAALRVNEFEPNLAKESASTYLDYLGQLPTNWPLLINAKFDLAAVAGALACLAVAYVIGKDQPAIAVVKGRRLLAGREALRRLKLTAKFQCRRFGQGIRLHEAFRWFMSLQREVCHFWIFGGVGSGKTQIISAMMSQVFARGDKSIIFDNKGDYTRWVPSFVLIAPWDKRSYAWDIGRDCVNPQHAKELSCHLVKEGKEAIWHESARQILTAMILELQNTQPKTWGWRALFEMACSPQDQVNGWILKNVPEARRIAESSGKTVDSIMLNFSSSLGLVSNLAQAWGDTPVERRFSIREWLQDDKNPRKTVVLQGNENYADLAQGYLQAIITLMSKQINSPEFSESSERRVWFFLDEFPQLHELKDFAPLLEIGRSKGIRVVLGAQDFSQVRELYGHDVAASWMSMVGTVIVAKLMSGETTRFICEEMLGEQTIERITFDDGKRQPPLRERQLVMEPYQLEEDLGPQQHGIRALLIGFGDVLMIDWPYTNLPNVRKPSVPAAWLNPPPSQLDGATTNNVPPLSPTTSMALTPESGKASMAHVPTTAPRLRLRPLSTKSLEDIEEMAISGTNAVDAADDPIDLTDSPIGGTHEPQ